MRRIDEYAPRTTRRGPPPMLIEALFYVFGAILVAASLAVIAARNPVYSALALVMCFVTSAAIWLLLQAEFLAIALVLVYVGAVMVLFLFVVMMLDINIEKMRERFRSYIPVAATVGILVLVEMALVILGSTLGDRSPTPQAASATYSNTRMLGLLIYTDYAYPFEI